MSTPSSFDSSAGGLARLPAVARLIDLALDEDLGRGDVTTEAVIGDTGARLEAAIVARAPLVICGLDVAAAVFQRVAATVVVSAHRRDGDMVREGTSVLAVSGPAAAILQAERTALNFLQRLSGIATQSRQYADAVAGTNTRVVDTRKTTPGYRVLEKAAVRAGGCHNHRFDLGAGLLIKDNHIAACGSVGEAVRRARVNGPHSLRVEVEVDTEAQLAEALDAGTDVVLLDNMSPSRAAAATVLAHERGVLVEVSGGINLNTVSDYAAVGVDLISVGALTHSAIAVDLALDVITDANSAGADT